MTKFKSLLYRELRIGRKMMVIQSVTMLGFLVFMWVGIILINKNPYMSKLTMFMMQSLVIYTAFICPAVFIGNDNIIKTDLNSGWLRYSYSLPITPFERAGVRIVRVGLITVLGVILSLLSIVGLCYVINIPFNLNYIVIYLIMIDVILLTKVVKDFFVLSARSTDEFIIINQRVEYFTLVVIGIIIAIIIKKSGISLHSLDMDSFKEFDIVSKLSAKTFMWAILLMILLISVHFAVTCYRFRSAYPFSVGSKKVKTEKVEKEDNITDTHDYPTGFLYKEIRQNKQSIIAVALLPFFQILFFLLTISLLSVLESNGQKGWIIKALTSNAARIGMVALGFFIVSGFIANIFKGDDRKLWSYFTVSTPAGVKGFMYYKYVLTFAMSGLYIVICIFADYILSTIRFFALGDEADSLISIYITVFYLLLFLSTYDIPFIVRFGAKKGSLTKIVSMTAIFVIVVLGFAVIPTRTQNKLARVITVLYTGGEGNEVINSTVMNVMFILKGIGPFIILALFILSYRVSCRFFIKGANKDDR